MSLVRIFLLVIQYGSTSSLDTADTACHCLFLCMSPTFVHSSVSVFNFRISLAQLIVGIVISPFVLQVSKSYEDYGAADNVTEMSLGTFMKWYFGKGFSCLLELDNDDERCDYSFIYLMGYVISLFLLQLTLTYVSSNQI